MIQAVRTGPPKTKDDVARALAEEHVSWEDSIQRIVRLRSANEDDADEPIKLLEVNSLTAPAGIVPVSLGPSEDAPFPLVVIEVTEDEFARVRGGELALPPGWTVAETLYSANGQQ
jgi:hypothetical protein